MANDETDIETDEQPTTQADDEQTDQANSAQKDIQRYRANSLSEQEGVLLYHVLADAEHDPHLAELYRKLADIEQRHETLWNERLGALGQQTPTYRPTWRIRALGWIARHWGVSLVVPIVGAMERQAMDVYDQQPEAQVAGLPADERSHARVFRFLQTASGSSLTGPQIAQFEGRHHVSGGNELRAAVLGASDGLTSNLSLVMGVAGFSVTGHAVLIAGLAGLLAGASSMAIGEWLSVQSARELYGQQIAIERQELKEVPDEEAEELSLIYQSKGIDEATATQLAGNLLKQDAAALDTLAREELGIDPQQLGGSAWGAAVTSFFLFAIGAIIPVAPFIFGSGLLAVAISLALSALGFFAIGAGVSLTTGSPLWLSSGRQVAFGLLAASVTFVLGRLAGAAIH
ncbi:MAG TPA: VIT1/CCC1 transporter family protein [Ktedonobacterales bacterium]|nr:VIT1/CCC1 transporter family protein [Ktedonobacterales bacterium]